MPVFFAFLYKFIFSLNGAGQELGADTSYLLMNIFKFFSLAFGVCWDTHYYHLIIKAKNIICKFALGWCDKWVNTFSPL